MIKHRLNIVVLFVFVLLFSACDNYNKILKKGTLEQKYEYAMKAYDKEQYMRALPLLEELIPVYRGTANGEKVMYYYAYSNYNTGDFILAGYHFKNFYRSFPKSDKAEECLYMSAYCYFLTSPGYSLDQTDTYAAIREFQTFINQFPKSSRVTEANETITQLRSKLETKTYEIAKLYYQISNYKAAIVAIENAINDYPGSKYNEELNYLLVRSHYLLTINSIDSKKPERISSTVNAYLKFIDRYPKTTYLKEVESVYDSTIKLKSKLKI